MATDEVLLQAAASGVATLRFYGWSPPTLSLGYFQPAAVRLVDPLLARLPFVRRATGGDTLVHDREVTYALALPRGRVWQGAESWALRMHRIIVAVLRAQGVAAQLAGAEVPPFQGPLCFHHHTPGDVLIGGAKVVGSAQRKQRGALLQHGGILCAVSPFTPGLAGIAELSGVPLDVSRFVAEVADLLHRETGWRLEPDALTPAEVEAVAALVREKYAAEWWNGKR
jgi:lipoate-protein ligase A